MKTNPDDPSFFTLEVKPDGSFILGKCLTKREYFAAMAMQGMLASCPEGIRWNPKEQPLPYKAWANSCVTMADALIAELNKEPTK